MIEPTEQLRTAVGEVCRLVEFGLKAKGEMTRQPWTPADDEGLRKPAGEDRTLATIAERMKRSQGSVRYRTKKLKIVANAK